MLSNDKLDAIREDWQMKYDHDISMCNDYIKDLESKIERLRGALSEIVQAYDNDEGSNFLVLHRVQRMARQALEGETK